MTHSQTWSERSARTTENTIEISLEVNGITRRLTVDPVTCSGDVEAGLAGAVARVDVTYTTPVQHNNPMEPHAALAAWDADGNLTVYDSTQGPSADRDTIASVLGLPPGRVRVISPHVGGGFGSKGTGHKGPSDERAANPRARENRGRTAGGVDVKGSSKQELMDRAAKLGIRGRSKMTKQELGEAIARKQD